MQRGMYADRLVGMYGRPQDIIVQSLPVASPSRVTGDDAPTGTDGRYLTFTWTPDESDWAGLPSASSVHFVRYSSFTWDSHSFTDKAKV